MADLLLVEWLDHRGEVGWQTAEHIAGLHASICRSVGWLVSEDETCLRLANSASEDEFDGVSIIVKSCIVSRRTIPA